MCFTMILKNVSNIFNTKILKKLEILSKIIVEHTFNLILCLHFTR